MMLNCFAPKTIHWCRCFWLVTAFFASTTNVILGRETGVTTVLNNECPGAIFISDMDDTIVGSTSSATPESDSLYCGIEDAPTVWFTMIGRGLRVRASTCSEETDYDTYLTVFSGDCSDLRCVDQDDDIEDDGCSFSELSSALEWDAENGERYYIVVHGFSTLSGNFGLTVLELPRPDNDNCDDSIDLSVADGLVLGSTASATKEIAVCDFYENEYPAVWYAVTGSGGGLRVSTCHNETVSRTTMTVFTGSCGELECLGVSTRYGGFCPGNGDFLSWPSIAGETYYVAVYGRSSYSDGPQDFGITIEEFSLASNDECQNAVFITSADFGLEFDGSTIGATVDFNVTRFCGGQNSPGVWFTVTGVGSRLAISTCANQTDDTAEHVSVFSGDCGNLECVGNGDSGGCDYSPTSFEWDAEEGVMYYILVHTYFRGGGDFKLTVTEMFPPGNDQCEDAIDLDAVGSVVIGSSDGATMDTFCGDDGSEYPGVWYTVTGTGNELEVSTCHNATTSQSALSVLTGACGNLECIGSSSFNDAPCHGTGGGNSLPWNSTTGQTYYVVVFGRAHFRPEIFGVSVSEFQRQFERPANDGCEDAVFISSEDYGTTFRGSTRGATLDFPTPNSCGVDAAPGVWFTVIGDGARLSASTCSPETTYDVFISVFAGDCSSLRCVDFVDDADCPHSSLHSTVEWDTQQGEVYNIIVHGFDESRGDFGLIVTEVFPPENDQCENAIALQITVDITSDPFMGTTIGASSEFFCENYYENEFHGPGVWYTVDGTGNWLIASTCNNETTTSDTAISVLTGTCGHLECLGGVQHYDSNCGSYGGTSIAWHSEVGETYHVLVVTGYEDISQSDFGILITELHPPPNDQCSNAIIISSAEYGTTFEGSTKEGSVFDAFHETSAPYYCGVRSSPGVWFSVTGEGTRLSASTCSAATKVDTYLSVFSGECNECVGASGESSCSGSHEHYYSTFEWDAEEGVVYYILVQGFPSENGNFGLTITEHLTPDSENCDVIADLLFDSVTQAGEDIVGTEFGEQFGSTVSSSEDGSIIAIGAPLFDSDMGRVQVFQNVDGAYTQMGADLVGEMEDDNFGVAVSLSADGLVLVVGSLRSAEVVEPLEPTQNPRMGAVRAFHWDGSSWQPLGQTVYGRDESNAVAVSGDGCTFAVGSRFGIRHAGRRPTGKVRVFRLVNEEWLQLGDNLFGRTAEDEYGASVSLSYNGNVVAAGGPYNEVGGRNAGHVRVFRLGNDSRWRSMGGIIKGEADDMFGFSVSLSADGTVIAVGAPQSPDRGYVQVLAFSGRQWRPATSKVLGRSSGDEFGRAVSLSADGAVVAAGSPHSRVVRVFRVIGDQLQQVGDDVEDFDVTGDSFGRSLQLSGNSMVLVVGATTNPYGTSGTYAPGFVRVFDSRSSLSDWEHVGEGIRDTDRIRHFGSDVSISDNGSVVAVGAPRFRYSSIGRVQVFQKYVNGEISQIGNDLVGEEAQDHFGTSISISSDGMLLAVGAPQVEDPDYHETHQPGPGYVKVFRFVDDSRWRQFRQSIFRLDGRWQQVGQTIVGTDNLGIFGDKVVISGDGTTLAIGNRFYGSRNSGQVQVYRLQDGAWSQLGEPLDGRTAEDQYGIAVDLSHDGNVVAVGGPYNERAGRDAGHVRVFRLGRDGLWRSMGMDIRGSTNDTFGSSVSLSADGRTLAVGATQQPQSGRGYIRVFGFENRRWVSVSEKIFGEKSGDEFGYSVSLSGGGTIVAAGSRYGPSKVFRLVSGDWQQLGNAVESHSADEGPFWHSPRLARCCLVLAVGFAAVDDWISGRVRLFEYSE